jgi:TRAP-type C4-dicarboxylate transport system permease small subunit
VSDGSRHSWWDRVERFGRAAETWLIVALLAGLIVFASAQIVLRNFFSMGLTWGDGLIRLTVLWLALLGALAASREGRHVTMGAITRWLPQRWQRGVRVGADLFAALVSGAFAWYSLQFVLDARELGDVLLNDVPAWWLQATMPVVFALMAVQLLVHALRRALRRDLGAEVADGWANRVPADRADVARRAAVRGHRR